jgi:peptide/nickel transport system substrate-binding protein
MSHFRWSLVAVLALSSLAGCYSSSPPPSSSPPTSSGAGTAETPRPAKSDGETTGSGEFPPPKNPTIIIADADAEPFWEDYPDVIKVPIMKDVDGIEIPRLEVKQESLQLKGEVPADVGNPRAKTEKEKANGDAAVVLMNSEPKTMNPITENSAVMRYMMEYVTEGLARQNPETFEFEPHMAQRWVTEDSIKLSPDTPGKERRVKLAGGEPQTQLEVDYVAAERTESGPAPDPVMITVITADKAGNPLSGVWVGVYPMEKILGASPTGYHDWSNAQGEAKFGGFPTGKYVVKVGDEIYGKSVKEADGSLVVTPGSDENPLHEELKSSGSSTLTLKPEEWIDRHEQTYFTYYLRPDVTWSDGSPYTTKDLEFAYAVLNNPNVDGDSIRVYYQDLVECKALGPYVMRMRYRQQYFKAFEFTTGMPAYGPPWHDFFRRFQQQGKELTLERLTPEEEQQQKKISAHGQEFGKFFNQNEEYNRKPLGTGPYVVGLWENADRLEMRRNPNYWLPERQGHLDKLIFKFITEYSTFLSALQTGIVDFIPRLNTEQYFEVLKGPPEWFAKDFVKAAWFTPSFGYVGWNELKPQFQDRRVRIALGMLFDKERFLETKLHNAGVIVSGPEFYFGPAYDHDVAPLKYSPDTARELLTEAGWFDSDNDGILDKDGVKFSIKALMPKGNPIEDDRMALLKNELLAVGIEMNILPMEWASFTEQLKQRDFDVVTLSWAMAVENDPYQVWHGSGAGKKNRGSNHVSYNNPVANELIEMLRITVDEKKRQRIEHSFHRLIDAEQPYQFLYCKKDLGAYHQRFRGVKWYRLRPGYDLTEWWVPKDEQLRKGD